MAYTKSLREISQLLKSKPGYVMKHKSGYSLIVNYVDLSSEDCVITCLKPDKNGEMKEAKHIMALKERIKIAAGKDRL